MTTMETVAAPENNARIRINGNNNMYTLIKTTARIVEAIAIVVLNLAATQTEANMD